MNAHPIESRMRNTISRASSPALHLFYFHTSQSTIICHPAQLSPYDTKHSHSRRRTTRKHTNSNTSTMCTGQRKVRVCKCMNFTCPQRGSLGVTISAATGHALSTEEQNRDYDHCSWFLVNGAPEHILNRYWKPDCPSFSWEDAHIPAEVCDACLKSCYI